MRWLNRNKLPLAVVSLVAFAAVGFATVRDARLDRAAHAELRRAKRESSSAMSYDDARAWLERNGFHVVTSSAGNFVGSKTTPSYTGYPTVQGFKRLAPDDLFGGRWIDLTFLFTPDEKFHDVELDHGVPPPRWSRPRAAGSSGSPASEPT